MIQSLLGMFPVTPSLSKMYLQFTTNINVLAEKWQNIQVHSFCWLVYLRSQSCRRGLRARGGLERGGLERGGLARGGLERGGLARGGLERGGLERGGLERGGLARGTFTTRAPEQLQEHENKTIEL